MREDGERKPRGFKNRVNKINHCEDMDALGRLHQSSKWNAHRGEQEADRGNDHGSGNISFIAEDFWQDQKQCKNHKAGKKLRDKKIAEIKRRLTTVFADFFYEIP